MNDLEIHLNAIKIDFESKSIRPSPATYEKMLELSHAQYKPGIELFEKILISDEYKWVQRAINALLHYENLEKSVLEKIRTILIENSNSSVKMAAADFLGLKSKWPDAALRKCLMTEEDRDVRISATRAVLELAKVNFRAVDLEIDRMKAGEIEPEFAEIERITQADADGVYKDLT
jgi:hypothetical protein